MSDTSKYINIYIENSIGLLHEYVSIILKTKTEARMAEELFKEKELEANRLAEEVARLRESTVNLSEAQENAKRWENEFHSMKQRVDHMDSMAASFNDAKHQLLERNKQYDEIYAEVIRLREDVAAKDISIANLTKQLKPFVKEIKVVEPKKSSPKKEINTVNKVKEETSPPEPVKSEPVKVEAVKPEPVVEPVKVEPPKVESAPKKGAIRLSQLKVHKEEEQTDDF